MFFSVNIAAGSAITLALIWRQRVVMPTAVPGTLMLLLTALTAAALWWATTEGKGRRA